MRVKMTAILLTLMLLVWAGWAQTPGSAKKAPAKKSTATTARKAPPGKQAASKKAATKGRYVASTKSKAGTKAPAGKSKSGSGVAGKGKAGGTKYGSTKSKYSRNTTYATRRPSYAPAQQQPTADRYREIQQALVERGYLNGEPTGQWDTQSAEALKRFQGEQNLEANGKLDSLSLIALGLGPKRAVSAQARPQ